PPSLLTVNVVVDSAAGRSRPYRWNVSASAMPAVRAARSSSVAPTKSISAASGSCNADLTWMSPRPNASAALGSTRVIPRSVGSEDRGISVKLIDQLEASRGTCHQNPTGVSKRDEVHTCRPLTPVRAAAAGIEWAETTDKAADLIARLPEGTLAHSRRGAYGASTSAPLSREEKAGLSPCACRFLQRRPW